MDSILFATVLVGLRRRYPVQRTSVRGTELDWHSLLTEGGVSGVDDVSELVALFLRCFALFAITMVMMDE